MKPVNYFRKFSWFWIWLLILGAIALVQPTYSSAYRQLISIFYLIPNFAKTILLGWLVLDIPLTVLSWKQPAVKHTAAVWNRISLGLLAVIYFDRIVLAFVSLCIDTAALDKNPDGFLESMVYMTIKSSRIWLNGIAGTLRVSLLGTLFGFLLAVLLVFLRISEPDKRDSDPVQLLKLIGGAFEKLYVTVIRGTPMMVQAAVIYYAGFGMVKSAMPGASITEVNQAWSFYTAGLITVSLNSAAYLAEVLRGGIEALDKGQKEAAESLGFTRWQAMTKVIFPQAVRNSMPAIGNEFIINIKDTSVLNIIGFVELMFATASVAGIYYKYLASYCIAAVIYLILTFSLTRLLSLGARRLGMPPAKSLPSSN